MSRIVILYLFHPFLHIRFKIYSTASQSSVRNKTENSHDIKRCIWATLNALHKLPAVATISANRSSLRLSSGCVCLPSQLFKGKFYYCVGFDVKNITNKSDCLAANYRWVHHKYNFDNLGQVREMKADGVSEDWPYTVHLCVSSRLSCPCLYWPQRTAGST